MARPTTLHPCQDPFARWVYPSLSSVLVVDNEFHPDLGLFTFDVVSDLVNGVNFINDGNPIWGGVIISATFLPTTFLLAWLAYLWVNPIRTPFMKTDGWKQVCVLKILLLLLLAPVAIPLATPAYVLYVVFVFGKRVKEPSYVSKHLDKLFKLPSGWKGKSRFAQPADLLKAFEAVLEANIQAIIGKDVLIFNSI